MVTQITPSQLFEDHPCCANDANKANDIEDLLFSFHASHKTRASPFLRTALNGFWLQRVAQFALKNWDVLFFLSRERKQLEQAKDSGKRIVWSQKHISKASQKQPGNLR